MLQNNQSLEHLNYLLQRHVGEKLVSKLKCCLFCQRFCKLDLYGSIIQPSTAQLSNMLGSIHRYLRKVDCSSFVMHQLLALAFQKVFMWWPLTALTRKTRQSVHAINQSIFNFQHYKKVLQDKLQSEEDPIFIVIQTVLYLLKYFSLFQNGAAFKME